MSASETIKDIVKKYGKNEKDTGSAETQVAILTHRINHITNHLKVSGKDFGSQRALLNLVGKRKRLFEYIKENDINKYRELLKSLNIRK